jgi:fermentation-respiration switch protein FrsA (DUF1100 family)
MAILLRILAGLGLAYLALLVLAWRLQDRMALPGARTRLIPPAQAGMPDGEIVTATAADGVRLKGWYLPPSAPASRSPAPGLLWFYGNLENVSGLAPVIRALRPPGVALLILDYRGYGESDGSPSERGLYLDAEAAWTLLASRPELDSSRIAVYGRSVGSVPALYLAAGHPVRAVIRVHYPFLPSFIVRISMNNLDRAGRLTAPLLVLHGDRDEIAPPWMGRTVAEAGHARELVMIRGAGHNETYDVGGTAYREKVQEFLRQYLR